MSEEKSTKHELLDALNEEFKDTMIEFEIDTVLNDPEIIIYIAKIKLDPIIASITELTEKAKGSICNIASKFNLKAEFSDINTVFWVKL